MGTIDMTSRILRTCSTVAAVWITVSSFASVEPATYRLLRPRRSATLDDLRCSGLNIHDSVRIGEALVLIDLRPEWMDVLARTRTSGDAWRLAVALDRGFGTLRGVRFTYSREGAFDAADGTLDNRRGLRLRYSIVAPVGLVVKALKEAGFKATVVLKGTAAVQVTGAERPGAEFGGYRYWLVDRVEPEWRAVAAGVLSWHSVLMLVVLAWCCIWGLVLCMDLVRILFRRKLGLAPEPVRWQPTAGLGPTLPFWLVVLFIWSLKWGSPKDVNALLTTPGIGLVTASLAVMAVGSVLRRLVGLHQIVSSTVTPAPRGPEGTPPGLTRALAVSWFAIGVPFLASLMAVYVWRGSAAAPVYVGLTIALGAAYFPVLLACVRRFMAAPAEANGPAAERAVARVQAVAARMGVQLASVTVALRRGPAYGSRRQAWVDIAGGVHLTRATAESLTDGELDAVAAHECAHIALRHRRYWLMTRWVRWAVYVPVMALGPIGTAFGGPMAGFAAVAAGCLLFIAPMWMLFCFGSRRLERAADRVALEVTGDLDAVESMLRKCLESPDAPVASALHLFETHQLLDARIKALRKHAHKLGMA